MSGQAHVRRVNRVGLTMSAPLRLFPWRVFQRSMPSDLIRRWIAVRVRKTRQIRNPEPRFDSVETQTALGHELMNAPIGLMARVQLVPDRRLIVASQRSDAMWQTEENSVRAHIFRLAELGDCSMQSTCLKSALSCRAAQLICQKWGFCDGTPDRRSRT
jgi:hypothetical protein